MIKTKGELLSFALLLPPSASSRSVLFALRRGLWPGRKDPAAARSELSIAILGMAIMIEAKTMGCCRSG